MQGTNVSAVKDVLERFRQDVVADLLASGLKPAPEADAPGNCFKAVASWMRLRHRSVSKAVRRVRISNNLQQRTPEPMVQNALTAISEEFERGDDLTHRLTRSFYRAGFNDFLFNTFGIHHIHLGLPGGGLDKTKKHVMSGGADALLFAMVEPDEVYFIDVLDHDVFDSAEMSKTLVQIVLRNWPDLLQHCIVPGVFDVDLSFEDAFAMQRAGFTTLFQVDGVVFTRGGAVFDGKLQNGTRAAGTSTEVVDSTNQILNRIALLVEHVRRETDVFAELAEARTGQRPSEFRLTVIRAGGLTVLHEENTDMHFWYDGENFGVLPG